MGHFKYVVWSELSPYHEETRTLREAQTVPGSNLKRRQCFTKAPASPIMVLAWKTSHLLSDNNPSNPSWLFRGECLSSFTITWLEDHQHQTSTLFWKTICIIAGSCFALEFPLAGSSRAIKPTTEHRHSFCKLFFIRTPQFASVRYDAIENCSKHPPPFPLAPWASETQLPQP